ncbi:uroporphyrinogen decarboxylase [Methylosinus sp. Sm6]|uniref:uroporphyrinogen decarboxylase n=1 Tax=Methylosinus sp. Sm6 TaxID=2866948 RepID=UPI001C9934B0|nr:uroporphyrinogen decarboxylase [Methylosinus sp. Sm6]MBY6241802.1 uroporphyrinogen decarboxylase [Methylosinus sp. Sm6]
MGEEKPLIAALRGEALDIPPIWLMRQAGRYLPEYRELRARAGSFLDTCYNPEVAARITLQPIERFGFDAAILFSDILVVPDALGQKVSFESGHGPKLEPIAEPKDLDRLAPAFDADRLAPVYQTIERVKRELPETVAFIGFCGAPWTVASYMIAGEGTPDQAPARLFAYRHPQAFARLIDRLIEASVAYLTRQIDAGVETVQLFDSWAGVLPPQEFERWVVSPLRRIIAELKQQRPSVPIIAFVRGAGPHLGDLAKRLGADALGLDTSTPPQWAIGEVPASVTLQGNLDPLALVAGGEALDRQIDEISSAFAGRPHIFNLGHGVLPETPLAHIARLVERVRNRG